MPTKSKRSAEKATVSTPDQFRTARLRLTFVYAGLLALALGLSSIVTYVGFSQGVVSGPVMRALTRTEPHDEHDSPQEELGELLEVLLLSNGLLLIAGSAFSYWLAGVTLSPIRESYERQGRFLGDVSHELRTPLAVIKTNIENEMFRAKKTGKVSPELAINLGEIDRMGAMLGDLLTLTRLGEESSVAKREVIDVTDVIEDSVERFASIAHSRSVSLDVVLSSDESVMALGEAEFLGRALDNVIKNAILYNKKGGSVTVSAYRRREGAVIKVDDTGVGMKEADVARAFERFYRADDSRSRETGGSGLGLSIVQSVMQSLGGSVRVDSVEGQGTTVYLTLPVA